MGSREHIEPHLDTPLVTMDTLCTTIQYFQNKKIKVLYNKFFPRKSCVLTSILLAIPRVLDLLGIKRL